MKEHLNFNSKEIVYPIFVILLSGINIFNNLNDLISLSVLNSLIGILGSILFIYRYSLSTTLIYFWTISQVIIITPYFDLSQVLKLTFGFTADKFGIYLNFPAIIFLGFLKIIEASNLVGKKIVFKEFRETVLGNIFPLTGIVKDRIDIGHEKNYLLVELDSNFQYENQSISYVLTKSKDKEKTLKLGKKDQIGFFRVVQNESDLKNSGIEKFPFIDWVRVE